MTAINKEDIKNIRKWVTSTNMEIHRKHRSEWSVSEDATWRKLMAMEKKLDADVH